MTVITPSTPCRRGDYAVDLLVTAEWRGREDRLLLLVAAAEAGSDHPVAAAITTHAAGRSLSARTGRTAR